MSQEQLQGRLQGHRVLIMAGGTGGHVFPALATAEVLKTEGAEVQWLGSIKGIENELVPNAGYQLHRISVAGLRGKGRLSLLLAPFKLLRALWQALRVLRQVRPSVVLGMGGFASGPGGLAAWMLGIPVCIHEQNAIPGMTNKALAKRARFVMEAFPNAFGKEMNAICTGNPIRRTIIDISAPEERLSGRQGPLRLLVVGGSLGAMAINEVVPRALALVPEGERPEVWHQAGARNLEATEATYQSVAVESRVVPFIADMNSAYEWADLVLCRAGALTVSELCAAGVAAILVPFPYAVDDHQTENARFMADAGAAVLVPQQQLTAQHLLTLLQQLSDRGRLLTMAQRGRALARVDASEQVAARCIEAVTGVAA